MSDAVDAVARFYEDLDPESLVQLRTLYAADARFRDPFNEVVGHAAIEAIFRHMFATLESPRFIVTSRISQGSRAALEWRFDFALRGRAMEIVGMSVLDFDDSGLVRDHRDYWDAAGELYARLPGIGGLMRWLRRRMSAHGG